MVIWPKIFSTISGHPFGDLGEVERLSMAAALYIQPICSYDSFRQFSSSPRGIFVAIYFIFKEAFSYKLLVHMQVCAIAGVL